MRIRGMFIPQILRAPDDGVGGGGGNSNANNGNNGNNQGGNANQGNQNNDQNIFDPSTTIWQTENQNNGPQTGNQQQQSGNNNNNQQTSQQQFDNWVSQQNFMEGLDPESITNFMDNRDPAGLTGAINKSMQKMFGQMVGLMVKTIQQTQQDTINTAVERSQQGMSVDKMVTMMETKLPWTKDKNVSVIARGVLNQMLKQKNATPEKAIEGVQAFFRHTASLQGAQFDDQSGNPPRSRSGSRRGTEMENVNWANLLGANSEQQ